MSMRLTLATNNSNFLPARRRFNTRHRSPSHEVLASALPAKLTTSMKFIYQNNWASSSRGETEASARSHGTFAGVDAVLYVPSGLISGTAYPENARMIMPGVDLW